MSKCVAIGNIHKNKINHRKCRAFVFLLVSKWSFQDSITIHIFILNPAAVSCYDSYVAVKCRQSFIYIRPNVFMCKPSSSLKCTGQVNCGGHCRLKERERKRRSPCAHIMFDQQFNSELLASIICRSLNRKPVLDCSTGTRVINVYHYYLHFLFCCYFI